MRRYLAWRQRNAERFAEARSINEYPGCFSAFARLTVGRAPDVTEADTVYYDFGAQRASTMRFGYFVPFARESYGRLTLTSNRMLFRASWMSRMLFLFRPPSSVGDFDITLDSITRMTTVPGLGRFAWGISWMPGLTMVDIETDDGSRYRIGGLQSTQWDKAIARLSVSFPSLTPSAHLRSLQGHF